jgi:hypothetical protein
MIGSLILVSAFLATGKEYGNNLRMTTFFLFFFLRRVNPYCQQEKRKANQDEKRTAIPNDPRRRLCRLVLDFNYESPKRMKYYGKLFGEERGKRTRYWDTGKTGKDWEDIEKERDEAREETMRVRDFMDAGFRKAKAELDDAAQTLADIMRDEVNAQDAAEKWLRAYAPHHLFPENNQTNPTR